MTWRGTSVEAGASNKSRFPWLRCVLCALSLVGCRRTQPSASSRTPDAQPATSHAGRRATTPAPGPVEMQLCANSERAPSLALSPDQRRAAFFSPNEGLFVIDLANGSLRFVVRVDAAIESTLAWRDATTVSLTKRGTIPPPDGGKPPGDESQLTYVRALIDVQSGAVRVEPIVQDDVPDVPITRSIDWERSAAADASTDDASADAGAEIPFAAALRTTIARSPDGRYLAVGYSDSTVRLFDLHASSAVQYGAPAFNRVAWTGVAEGGVRMLVFSPNSRRLAVGISRTRARVIDLDRDAVARMPRPAWWCSFSPRGRWLGCLDERGETCDVWIANARTGQRVMRVEGHSCEDRVAFSEDETRAALVASTVSVWALGANALAHSDLDEPRSTLLHRGAFSAPLRLIVTSSSSGHIHAYDQSTLQTRWRIAERPMALSFAAFSPDLRRFVVRFDEESELAYRGVSLWESETLLDPWPADVGRQGNVHDSGLVPLIEELRWSEDSARLVFVSNIPASVGSLDPQSGAMSSRIALEGHQRLVAHRFGAGPEARFGALSVASNALHFTDAFSGQSTVLYRSEQLLSGISTGETSSFVIVRSNGRGVLLGAEGQVVGEDLPPDLPGMVSPDARWRIANNGQSTTIEAPTLPDGGSTGFRLDAQQVLAAAWTADSARVALCSQDTLFWGTTENATLASIPMPEGECARLQWLAGGRGLAIQGRSRITVLRTADRAKLMVWFGLRDGRALAAVTDERGAYDCDGDGCSLIGWRDPQTQRVTLATEEGQDRRDRGMLFRFLREL